MGTRSQIKIISEEKEYVIYSQFDGYLEGVGKTLVDKLIKTELYKSLKERLSTIEELTDEIIQNGLNPKAFYLLNPSNLTEDSIEKLNLNIDSLKNVESTWRLYDRGDESLIKIAQGEGNFLFYKKLNERDYNVWIEYDYTLDLDNKIFSEKNKGVSLDFSNIETFEDVMKFSSFKYILEEEGLEEAILHYNEESFITEEYKDKYKKIIESW